MNDTGALFSGKILKKIFTEDIMTKRVKRFFFTGFLLFISIFIIAASFSHFVYFGDCLKSGFIHTFRLYSITGSGVSILNPGSQLKYKKTFAGMGKGFFHYAGILFYTAPTNISAGGLSEKTIEITAFSRINDLKSSLDSVNKINRGIINSGETVIIPGTLPCFTVDIIKNRPGRIVKTKGLYFTGNSAGDRNFSSMLDLMKDAGLNTIVFDIKDITGIVHTRSSLDMVKRYKLNKRGAIDNLPKLLRECRKRGLYIIARVSLFSDHLLYDSLPSVRIKSKSTGRGWNSGSREKWCDPTSRIVQDYNISLAQEAAAAGVDEIQFDYVRFPTTGDMADADYAYDFGRMERTEVIAHFLKRAGEALTPYNVSVSIDIFGVVAWGKEIDIKKTGQRVEMLAQYCDVISPMLYPSHFNDNFDGFSKPGDNPYHFILSGCKRVKGLAGDNALVRPWLQAFPWRVSRYNADYIAKQIKAADDSGAQGYLFWNASNSYNEVLQAMRIINAGK
jgi:hypothetical protein